MSSKLRFLLFTSSTLMLAASLLACMATVEGDRAATGLCPEGEVCSSRGAQGLQFIGQAFFDEESFRLGPVAVGGTFQLGLVGVDERLGDYDVELEDGLTVVDTAAPFEPVDEEGNSLVEVDDHIILRGRTAASSYVRITDPIDGTLIDRLPLDVVEIDEVEFGLAREPDRDFLVAGCPELVAVRLLSTDASGTERRIFDQSLVISADGEVLDEQMWDCISFEAAEGASEATFQIDFANATHVRTMPVRSLAESGMMECPANRD